MTGVAPISGATPKAEIEPSPIRAREPAERTGATPASEGPGSLAGRVTDRAGRPVVGARCELRPGVPVGGFFERAPLSTVPASEVTATDADGRFLLAAPPGQWSLRVESPGFARFEHEPCVAGDELRVRLDPEVWLLVTVLDAGGAPLEGAEVTVRPARANAPEEWRVRVRTDARGRVATNALAPGTWRLAVEHPEHAAVAVPLDVPIGSGRIEREIRLERGACLVGTVRSREGTPIAGARVRIESPYAETFRLVEVTSDEAGRYATGPLFSRSETLEVLASAAGHAESGALVGIQARDVAAGSLVQDFELERAGRTVRGRVVKHSGAGVSGASVRVAAIDLTGTSPGDLNAPLQATPSAPWLWQECARTSDSGSFQLTALASEREYALLIVHGDYAPRTAWSPADAPGSVHDLGDLPLSDHGSLFGRVRFEDGTPAAGERVSVFRTNRVYLGTESLAAWRPEAWFHSLTARADQDGRFRFDQLAPGAYQVLPSMTAETEVLPGAATGPIEVVLQRAAQGPVHQLGGIVLDPAGEPIPMVFVRAVAVGSTREELLAASLAAEGKFALRLPPAGAVRVTFTDLRGRFEGRELVVDSARAKESLEVVLEPRAVPLPPIDGLVYGPRGDTLEGCTVTLHPPEDSLCGCITFQRKTDAAGAFRFSVAEGPHRLVASDPRYASATHAPAWPGDHVEFDLGPR